MKFIKMLLGCQKLEKLLQKILKSFQASLVICNFTYMWLKIGHFYGTYPLLYSQPWSFYMQIHYLQAYIFGPYLSHTTKDTCTLS